MRQTRASNANPFPLRTDAASLTARTASPTARRTRRVSRSSPTPRGPPPGAACCPSSAATETAARSACASKRERPQCRLWDGGVVNISALRGEAGGGGLEEGKVIFRNSLFRWAYSSTTYSTLPYSTVRFGDPPVNSMKYHLNLHNADSNFCPSYIPSYLPTQREDSHGGLMG